MRRHLLAAVRNPAERHRPVGQAEGHCAAGRRNRDWVLGCELAWQACASVEAAEQLERRLRAAYMPPLNATSRVDTFGPTTCEGVSFIGMSAIINTLGFSLST